jgi:hypothetical protein
MSDARRPKETFNNKSLVHFLKDYTTSESKKMAMYTLKQSKRATDAAEAAFKKVAAKHQSAPAMHLTPAGARKEYERKREAVYKANEKLHIRIDKIGQAKKNRLDRIKEDQKLEKRVEQKTGRSLSQEFGRRR